jgi:hypothetical protein
MDFINLDLAMDRLAADLRQARPCCPHDLISWALAKWPADQAHNSHDVAKWLLHDFLPVCKESMER